MKVTSWTANGVINTYARRAVIAQATATREPIQTQVNLNRSTYQRQEKALPFDSPTLPLDRITRRRILIVNAVNRFTCFWYYYRCWEVEPIGSRRAIPIRNVYVTRAPVPKTRCFFYSGVNHVNFSVPLFRTSACNTHSTTIIIIVAVRPTYPKYRETTLEVHTFYTVTILYNVYEITAILGRTTVVRLAAEGPRSRSRSDTSWRMRAYKGT